MQEQDALSFSIYMDSKSDDKEKKIIENLSPASNLNRKKIGILPRRTCVWVDDESVDECYQCHSAFTWYIRRHHCRGCGRIFCYNCSKYTINATEINKSGIIDPEKYLIDSLKSSTNYKSYRACAECLLIFNKIRELSSLISIFELLPLEITEFYNLRRISRMWYEACNIILSRFREIQYNLPNNVFTQFEKRILKNNLHLIIGHNKLVAQFIKSVDWDKISLDDLDYNLQLIKATEQTCTCWALMCCRECQKTMTDSEVIDILLHVKAPAVRLTVLECLSQDIEILECYIPMLTYTIRLDEETYKKNLHYYTVRDHLINLSIESENIRYKFFWELLVQLEEPQYNSTYRETLEIFLHAIETRLGSTIFTNLKNGMKLVNSLSQLSVNAANLDQLLINKLIDNDIYEKEIPIPIRPDLIMAGIEVKGVKIMKSATSPIYIPCQIKDQKEPYSFIYKSEDIRKDHIVSCIIRVMDRILKSSGLDMNIITYNILPTAMNSGLIEIVPNSETLYNIKEKSNYSIQNYILENNKKLPVEEVRNRFIKSTAAYCVITYLLGIGDRHMDNIMVTKDGRLFHIDYSFMLGLDPKPLAPKMRITGEMIDALGGIKSSYYKAFEEYCSQCYNILRRHANLFTNMLFLLTKIDKTRFTTEQLEIEIAKRFLPGEYRSQAKIQLIKTINNSQAASTFVDFIHYQYKERLSMDNWGSFDFYEKANNIMSYIDYINPISYINPQTKGDESSKVEPK